ncbi:hypothetical protein VTH06DRAFT_3176 [Thermothelomyces fergusii]
MRASLSALLLWTVSPFVGVAVARGGQCNPGNLPQIIAHTGTPVGREETYDGAVGIPKIGLVYLTDVFGIPLVQNKLLADSFARAGFLVVTPDLFDGEPAPVDLDSPSFNFTDFNLKHNPTTVDPIVDVGVAYLAQRGVDAVVATGYCFGGRYAFRALAPGRGVDAAFAAHPSLLEDAEIAAITKPVSVAAAETDATMSPERRQEIEELLADTAQPYQINLYGGTSHGFGVRADVSDPEQKFGKESAFWQAVRWFHVWAGDAL